jgi:hypothetical protein
MPGELDTVYEYATDIAQRNFTEECRQLVDPTYMDRQDDITPRMRSILVDWLVEVQERYRLRYITLHLTVSIIDRYLSLRNVRRRHLQLVGVTAMFIASKYEEIDPPKVDEFAYITDSTYSRNEILNMECQVLVVLNFQIAKPTPAHFFDTLQRNNGGDDKGRHLAQYALDLALLEDRCLQHSPSVLVSAALYISNRILGRRELWPATMAAQSRHTEAELQACIQQLDTLITSASSASLQGIRRRYQTAEMSRVADLI